MDKFKEKFWMFDIDNPTHEVIINAHHEITFSYKQNFEFGVSRTKIKNKYSTYISILGQQHKTSFMKYHEYDEIVEIILERIEDAGLMQWYLGKIRNKLRNNKLERILNEENF